MKRPSGSSGVVGGVMAEAHGGDEGGGRLGRLDPVLADQQHDPAPLPLPGGEHEHDALGQRRRALLPGPRHRRRLQRLDARAGEVGERQLLAAEAQQAADDVDLEGGRPPDHERVDGPDHRGLDHEDRAGDGEPPAADGLLQKAPEAEPEVEEDAAGQGHPEQPDRDPLPRGGSRDHHPAVVARAHAAAPRRRRGVGAGGGDSM
ncbi:hypothetical protein [Clavibacter tessellarius]|uniref:hypothetical protein n=1 Tax=Clavibacter tessellarius TaxID=31965 RepID=UPI003248519B